MIPDEEAITRAIALIRDWWSSAKDPKRPHTWPGHPHWFEVSVRKWHARSLLLEPLLQAIRAQHNASPDEDPVPLAKAVDLALAKLEDLGV